MRIVSVRRTVEPSSEPVTLAEAKVQLRESGTAEDTHIESLITTSRQVAENMTQRAFITQTWAMTLSDLPSGLISLPRPPFISLTTLQYRDTAGAWQTLDQAGLDTIQGSIYGVLDFSNLAASPVLGDFEETIKITWSAGYGNAAAVPKAVKQWILMHVGSSYAARESEILGQGYTVSKLGFADGLLDPYRVESFA